MTEIVERGKRFAWVDWMKALGIYLIVLGHFYSVGEVFLYVFHVPLFFAVSGFLNKRETESRVFWKKLWYNLVVPMLLMATANFLYHCIVQMFKGTFSPVDVYWFVRNLAFGMVSGLDTLWFVYTLIFLKIVYQYIRPNKFFYALTAVMLLLAYVYNHVELSGYPFFMSEPSAFIDVCTAYPFFALGVYIRNVKGWLNSFSDRFMLLAMVVGGLMIVTVCSAYNGHVGMFRCDYGENILLFLLGAVAGTVMIWAIAKLAGPAPGSIIVISRGTIIILGFHKMLIDLVRAYCTPSALDVVFALLILLLFFPIIVATEKVFPLLAGKYRTK